MPNVSDAPPPAGAPATGDGACLRVAFGPIGTVKAVASRGVSVICLEVPDSFHVEVTNLLHGRDALLCVSTLPTQTPYGVLDGPTEAAFVAPAAHDPNGHEAPVSAREAEAVTPLFVHGYVALVRPVPARQVSIICVEIPEESHVEATSLLYGRDAIALPVALGASAPYGMLDPDRLPELNRPRRDANDRRRQPSPAATPRAPTAASAQRARPGAPGQLNIARWLGARCTEEMFQSWLGVRNEAQASARVRAICDVGSRKDIPKSREATERFMRQIYEPFRLHEARKGRRGWQQASALIPEPAAARSERAAAATSPVADDGSSTPGRSAFADLVRNRH